MNDFNQQLALVGAATSYSDVYQLPADVGHVEASAVVSAIAGTTPTLIVTVQTSQDKVTWEDRNVLPTFDATGTKKVRASEPRIYFRFKLVLAGTTPTATVTLFAIGREGEGDSSEMLILQDAAGATGNGNVLDVVGQASAVIAITGTFSATVTFEGTLDGTNWFAVNATKVGDGGVASTATTTGLYRIACASITSLRARVSTWASGALTATGRTTQNDSGSYDNIPNSTAGADAASNTSSRSETNSRINAFNGTTWDRIRAGITTISATLTGFLNTLPWGIYHATPSTRTEGQGGPLETDNAGSLRSVEQKKPGAEYNSEKYIAVSQKYVNTTTNKPVSTVNLSFQTATVASSAILLVGARIVNTSAGARWLFLNNATSIAGAAAPTVPPVQIAANSSVTLTPEELGGAGYRFDTALTVGNSSTPSSFTAGTSGDLLIQLFTTTATS